MKDIKTKNGESHHKSYDEKYSSISCEKKNNGRKIQLDHSLGDGPKETDMDSRSYDFKPFN